MKTIKKSLSILLVLVTIFSISAVSTLSASAATNYESESNDSYSTADNLKLNSSIEGILSNRADVDIYKITTGKSGKLTISFNHTYTSEDCVFWHIYVYQYSDGKYNELSYKEIKGSDVDEKIEFPSVGTVESGTYYVKVCTGSSWNYENTPNHEYSISNNFKETSYYEREMNDAYATATKISVNNSYNGYLSSRADVDIYKITTSKNGNLTLKFNHTYTSEDCVFWHVYIYQYSDGKYNELSFKEIKGRDSNEQMELCTIKAMVSGVYYVKVCTGSAWNYENTPNHEYGILAKSSTEPSVDIGTGGNDDGNDNNVTDSGFSFMDVLNAVLDFFKWLFNAVLAFFS